jgi:hypothetical protein
VVACDARPPRLLFSYISSAPPEQPPGLAVQEKQSYIALANKNTPAINWFIFEIIV